MSSVRTLLARARRMDEAVVADVDADVRERPLQGVEEDEVAGRSSSRLTVDQAGRRRLLVGAARQHQAEAHLEDVAREAAAVEAGLGRRAAAPIADADEVHGRDGEVGRAVVHLAQQAGSARAGVGLARGAAQRLGEQPLARRAASASGRPRRRAARRPAPPRGRGPAPRPGTCEGAAGRGRAGFASARSIGEAPRRASTSKRCLTLLGAVGADRCRGYRGAIVARTRRGEARCSRP